jgi:hypothetical protein
MMTSFEFNFDPTPKAAVTAAANSTNVYDAGSAKKLFDGTGKPFRINGFHKANSGTNPTMRVQFVGADDAALTSNVITIVETGTSPVAVAGTVNPFELIPQFQSTAKRYYGLIYTPAGTTPNFDVTAAGGLDLQSNMPALKAAVP